MSDSQIKEATQAVLNTVKLLNKAFVIAADDLQSDAEDAAPAIHVYGRKITESIYAINLLDDLWLRSDAKFAKGYPNIPIEYIEVARQYDVIKISNSILKVIKKYIMFLQEKMDNISKWKKIPTSRKPKPPTKPKPSRHLRSV